jgi:hypothetical protein
MTDASRSRGRIVPLAGGLGALAVDVLYLMAIAQQGVSPPGGRVPFVAGWIAVAGVLATIGTFIPAAPRRAMALGFAAAMLVALGVPAVSSVGIPLLICAALVGIGAIRAAEIASAPRWLTLAAPISLLLVAGAGVALGFAITEP